MTISPAWRVSRRPPDLACGPHRVLTLYDGGPDKMLGDKGYDSDEIRDDLTDRGIEPVIPSRSNRKTMIDYDRQAYKRSNLIEQCFNPLCILKVFCPGRAA
jgi:hypothetical protein